MSSDDDDFSPYGATSRDEAKTGFVPYSLNIHSFTLISTECFYSIFSLNFVRNYQFLPKRHANTLLSIRSRMKTDRCE